jgi:hypothetical protein
MQPVQPADNVGGAREDRTPDLSSAIAALSHLSYCPTPTEGACNSDLDASVQRWKSLQVPESLPVRAGQRRRKTVAAAGQISLGSRAAPWMPREDSNLDKRSQSPLSYH